jgi:hypothetical protein
MQASGGVEEVLFQQIELGVALVGSVPPRSGQFLTETRAAYGT